MQNEAANYVLIIYPQRSRLRWVGSERRRLLHVGQIARLQLEQHNNHNLLGLQRRGGMQERRGACEGTIECELNSAKDDFL